MIRIEEVNPNTLTIDPLNERRENIASHDIDQQLVESVRQQGVVQPPVARADGDTYKVIVGQRRTIAAQTAGIETVPLIVVEWDDTDATLASITENIDAFNNSVSRTDRAAAIQRLQAINNWSQTEVAEALGIHPKVVSRWLERTQPAWEETDVHVEQQHTISDEQRETVEDVGDDTLRAIRQATGGGTDGERVVERVAQDNLSKSQVVEAKKRYQRGEDFEEVLDELTQQRSQQCDSDIKVNVNITFSGEYAGALQEEAKHAGTSEQQIVQAAMEAYLEEKDHFS